MIIDDYLPFGLSFNSYSRAAITAQNFKFNAGSELEEMTDWYSTPFRKYDPSLGRFHGVDALADMYTSVSPSQYGLNNPISYNDPTGLTTAPGDPENGGDGGLTPCNCTSQQYYGMGVRGGGKSPTAGSGSHWTDRAWGSLIGTPSGWMAFVRNTRALSSNVFNSFYGKSVDEARWDAARNGASGLSNSEKAHYLTILKIRHLNAKRRLKNKTNNNNGSNLIVSSNTSFISVEPGNSFQFVPDVVLGIEWMLKLQKFFGVEISGYHALSPDGIEGILILPFSGNGKNNSDGWISVDTNDDGQLTIMDDDENTYIGINYFHTHPDDNGYLPSGNDWNNAGIRRDMGGINSYVITNSYFFYINPDVRPRPLDPPTGTLYEIFD